LETPIKPIFLLADSQLLFWNGPGPGLAQPLRQALDDRYTEDGPKAAYLGASNGDAPEFYDLFVAAMGGFDIHNCRMIPSIPASEDLEFLAEADLILLAGGDTSRGWLSFKNHGIIERIIERYYGGTVLMGVSAGAVQLGQRGWQSTVHSADDLFSTFQLIPFVVDVHDEPDWNRLKQVVRLAGSSARGIGIPSGGGAIFHPDWSLEPLRHPLVEFTKGDDQLQQAMLLPSEGGLAGAEAPGEADETR
jgi:peptidase E